ncbi:MAG: hypothetical protein K6C94_10020 [Candidatus Gastranaerophilales bacterium]|nr:hypothetical protein [Candidatus Gastranaerophilales bacterium]
MSDGINFIPRNIQSNRFVNTHVQTNKADMAANIINTAQQTAIKNTSEFITQSAKSMYQFFANMQSAQMRDVELANVLKELLNMQKDMEAFLTNIADKNTQALLQQMTSKPNLANLLMNSQMDLSKLMQFMQENGKEALSKMFRMTADFSQSGVVARSSQISELIAILNACTPNTETSQAQLLKNMMLLYLPWLPLGEQNFSVEIGAKGENGEDGKVPEDSISILISTVNYGNVRVLIYKADMVINFDIFAGEKFPKDKVMERIKAEAREYNVQTEMSFEKKENLEKTVKPETAQTQVSVNTGKHINPFLILMAQTVVRIIIETDKNVSLVENRRERMV